LINPGIMARVLGNGFSGRIANLIYYQRNGQCFVRSTPARVRQTKATKARSGEFGRASALGKAIRKQLLPIIPNPRDHKMQLRLVATIFKWLQSVKSRQTDQINNLRLISRFEFTDQRPGALKRWRVPFNLRIPSPGVVEINIPAFTPEESVQAPAHTVSVTCKIIVAVLETRRGFSPGSSSYEWVMDYNSPKLPAQTISMNLPAAKGSLVVMGLSLAYQVIKNGEVQDNMNKAFMPAGIVDAMYIS
jgi:hypothetical protein